MKTKRKTFVRAVARKTGVHASNLSGWAKDHKVPITDAAALTALALEHKREPDEPDEPEASEPSGGLYDVVKRLSCDNTRLRQKVGNCQGVILDLLQEVVGLRELLIKLLDGDHECFADLNARQAEDLAFITEFRKLGLNTPRSSPDSAKPDAPGSDFD
ncbi:MAG TPA: hypothetical protein VH619_05565 [Verrucomicrobiae bacterium]|jgi:hypothetical protein|nr:hypothetical protein [Verrucomicrobiae bacterium]